MSTHIFIAPTAAGKTAWVVEQARAAAAGLRRSPLIVVATPLQALALRRRLAASGGALGVQVETFDGLYAALLQQARVVYTELDGPVRHRLLRVVLDDLAGRGDLAFYRNLVARPGFITAVEALLGELKGAGIRPDALEAALAARAAAPRLVEMGTIYAQYQALLDANGWTDRPGVAWLVLAALAQQGLDLPPAWGPIFFDGFDSFTVVQRAVIRLLGGRTLELFVLLTGVAAAGGASPYALFGETAALLAQELGVTPSPLPPFAAAPVRLPLYALADALFVARGAPASVAAPVDLLAAADRSGEVRAALRWLKQRVVLDGAPPGELVLMARNVSAYRDLVLQTAAEFGMRVYMGGSLPLAANPAIAALLDLLHLMLPDPPALQPRLLRRGVVEAWRSPYFNWAASACAPGIGEGDAEQLDLLARRYLVIRGLGQWREAFALAAAAAPQAEGGSTGASGRLEADDTFAGAPAAASVEELALRFARFVTCLAPPVAAVRLRDYVCWLEELIGPDPLDVLPAESEAEPATEAVGDPQFTLDMVACIRSGEARLQARDIAALRCFKEVLRGFVWAEEAAAVAQGRLAGDTELNFSRFLGELVGAVAATTYEPPAARDHAILFTDLHTARGVSFAAAAILGLAEGELPRRRSEDPFLRNDDRRRLRACGLPLEDSTRSFEREAFYTAVARGRDHLLLCRPRLAENGAPWEPSPYWQDVERLVGTQATLVPGEQRLALAEVASLPELVESALRQAPAAAWLHAHAPGVLAQMHHGAGLAAVRAAGRLHSPPSPFDGFLGDDTGALRSAALRLRRWSPTALERYRACPYWYYLSYVLRLEPRPEPEEGANFAQTGSLYHRILEQVYRAAADPTDLAELLALLPQIATAVLDAAPQQDGFRVTAWWSQIRAEIESNVAASLEALAAYDGTPMAFEAAFGGDQALRLVFASDLGEVEVSVSGKIDRVDRRPDGSLRIIDYKTGVGDYDNARTLGEGRRLQLALYALAAQEALGLGRVSDGFYWFAHKARPSWTLAEFQDPETGATGPQAAIEIALHYAAAAVTGARKGEYAPQPPTGGCPDYCTAAGFCWHYRPKYTR
jgi:hypothetical protein